MTDWKYDLKSKKKKVKPKAIFLLVKDELDKPIGCFPVDNERAISVMESISFNISYKMSKLLYHNKQR